MLTHTTQPITEMEKEIATVLEGSENVERNDEELTEAEKKALLKMSLEEVGGGDGQEEDCYILTYSCCYLYGSASTTLLEAKTVCHRYVMEAEHTTSSSWKYLHFQL